MATEWGENGGFDLLPEFTGRAVPEPGVVPPGAVFAIGENAGMDIQDEIAVDLRRPADPDRPVADGLTDRERAALRLVADGGSLSAVARGLGLSSVQAADAVLTAVESIRSRLRAS